LYLIWYHGITLMYIAWLLYLYYTHNSLALRGPEAQTANGDFTARAADLYIKCFVPLSGCDPEGSSFGSRVWFYSGTPSY